MTSFVRSAKTTVKPDRSRLELERLLVRYGALGFAYAANIEAGTAQVEFVIPNGPAKDAPRIPVRIPVNVCEVYDVLYGRPTIWDSTVARRVPMPRPYRHDPKRMHQAECVAWRNLILWVDAALSSASVGLRTIADSFAGDRLVTTDDGRVMRVNDLIEANSGALPGGYRALLLPGASA